MTQAVVQQWDIFELSLPGPGADHPHTSGGNPFLEVSIHARFDQEGRVFEAEGFYDGDGLYRLRFMPDAPGEWRYVTRSNASELDRKSGAFMCVSAQSGVHGPVRVAKTFHFVYADGTPYLPTGTTCYAWIHQPDKLQKQTLRSLAASPFNKVRMCVFPKHYTYNTGDPSDFPFAHNADGEGFDFERFNPAFFRRFEGCVADLAKLGIEADLILFHPYDRWGFAGLPAEVDDRYLRYITARLSAYRNVWWSLANEYDLMAKSEADWDRFFQILQRHDPYNHLRSIHNWQGLDTHDTRTFYDHAKPWVTHCSIQHAHVDLISEWRERYGKPVIDDECCYEGDLPNGWGNLTGEEMVRRFWEATSRGGYASHGETYLDPEDVVWWSKGGRLKGKSPKRIAFLRRILESLPPGGLDPLGEVTNTHIRAAGQPGRFYLTYFGFRQPGEVTVTIAESGRYRVEIIDTWNTSIQILSGSFEHSTTVRLPGKPYLALLIRAVE
jgi:hypothetical protein